MLTAVDKLSNIGGPTPNDYLERISPLTGKKAFTVPISGDKEVNEVVRNAHKSYLKFSKVHRFKRSAMLLQAANHLELNSEKLISAVRLETGKSHALATSEFHVSMQFMKALAGYAHFHEGNVIPSADPSKLAYTRLVPFGVAGLIVSFNTPIPNYVWKFAPSFMAGNTSILKPSPFTSYSAQLFVKLLIESGVPSESIFLIHGSSEAGRALVASDVELISFTGSSLVGKDIQMSSRYQIRKLILELGGCNPFIVTHSANLSLAAEYLIQSAFSNAGQRCAAGSRLIIHSKIEKDFLEILDVKLSKATLGSNDEDLFGPLIDKTAMTRHADYLNSARSFGLSVREYGNIHSKNDYLPRIALVEKGNSDFPKFYDEVFSPILRIERVSSNAEAVRAANASNYGLTAAVWTQNVDDISFFTENIDAGVINVNGPTHGSEFQFPFGGKNDSGNGTKEVGFSCLTEYSDSRLITIKTHAK
jgi:acyl-CoA reductase-like NAD-dependent aldehyde dehydrogenase